MNTEGIELFIRQSANRMGWDLHRYRVADTLHGQLATMLKHHKVDTVLDVGANVGQFAGAMRRAGYTGRIVSFEPLSSAYEKLIASSRKDAEWTIADRAAIGSGAGEAEIHVSRNSFSSSLLDMLPSHRDAAPDSEYIDKETVQVVPLDTAAERYLSDSSRLMIKIDTQGYESHVLDGACSVLERAAGVHLELSFVPLYAGQPTYKELVGRLEASGFTLWGVWSGIHDPATGRMLQFDASFFRDEA